MHEPEKNPYDLPPDFKFVKKLGSGNDGFVLLCQYHGTNEKIKSLCDANGYIAAKVAKEGKKLDLTEANISKEIEGNTAKNPTLATKLNPVIALNNAQGEVKCFLSRVVSYSNKEGLPISSDIQSFFVDAFPNLGAGPTSSKLSLLLQNDLSIALSQLTSGMHASQTEMHIGSIVHLDTAARNYLLQIAQQDKAGNIINLLPVLIDYNRSQKISDHQSVAMNTQEAPIRYLSSAVYATHQQNVASDLFALRCAIIEMVGFASGATDVNQVLTLSDDYNNHQKFIDLRLGKKKEKEDDPNYRDDKEALAKYLDNVVKLIEKCPDKKKKAELELFVTTYKDYLTSMPPPGMSNTETRDYDRARLLSANGVFVNKCYLNRINPENMGQVDQEQIDLLSARLCSIDVNDKFKKSFMYQGLIEDSKKIEKVDLLQKATPSQVSAAPPKAVVTEPNPEVRSSPTFRH